MKAKDSKKRRGKKKSSSSDDDSGTDSKAKSGKRDQTSNQDNNVGSRDDAQPRTSKKKDHVHVDSSASDVDTHMSSKES